MLFDTGSSGLRIFQEFLGKTNYIDTGELTNITLGNTRTYYGTVGEASGITIGETISIAKSLKFQIVKSVCTFAPVGVVPKTPAPNATPPMDCAAQAPENIAKEEQAFGAGVFGARPQVGESGVYSLMSELPGQLANGFIVSAYPPSPMLIVGATAINSAGFQLFAVNSLEQPDGAPYWAGNQFFPWCFTVTPPGETPACPSGGVLTDSGGNDMRIYVDSSAPPGISPRKLLLLPPGLVVTARLGRSSSANGASAIEWQYTTGKCVGYNAPFFYFGAQLAAPESNTGIYPFLMNDILYDLRGGHFGFRPIVRGMLTHCPQD